MPAHTACMFMQFLLLSLLGFYLSSDGTYQWSLKLTHILSMLFLFIYDKTELLEKPFAAQLFGNQLPVALDSQLVFDKASPFHLTSS